MSETESKVEYSDNTIFAKRYSGVALIKFWLKIYFNYFKTYLKLARTLILKECYYGPFKGEFGHFLAHNLPFLMYLYSKGVKIHYCGMDLHKPFLVDENKKSIIAQYFSLRDFFSETSPKSNSTIPPEDVQGEIKKFQDIAVASGKPYWNIGDDYYYWFIHRNLLLKGFTKSYNLEKAYKTKDEFSACVFARSKGAGKISKNNGEPWDYEELLEKIKPYFEKVYMCGHPSQCLTLSEKDNVELCVTTDNSKILEKCANSKLIITQHSGVNNLGEYTNNQVLVIYKGGNKVNDIGSIQNTLRFRPSIGKRHPLSFAFSMDEVVSFVREFSEKAKSNAS